LSTRFSLNPIPGYVLEGACECGPVGELLGQLDMRQVLAARHELHFLPRDVASFT
jgi:hypothetical protein